MISGVQVTFGAQATALSALLPSAVKQLDIIASPDNSGNVYIGGAGVTTTPTNAWAVLEPGKPWGALADDLAQINVGSGMYIIGTEGEIAHLMWVL